MVSRRALLGISAVVWMMAGTMVLRVGVAEFAANFSLILVPLAVLTFVPFFAMFSKMVTKNDARIAAMPTDRNRAYTFFTPKTYVIIAFMMTLGMVLRSLPVVPRTFIAFFYVGLGAALFIAGVRYAARCVRFGRVERPIAAVEIAQQ